MTEKKLFVNILLSKLVNLMIRDINKGIIRNVLFKKNIIRVFFNLKLI